VRQAILAHERANDVHAVVVDAEMLRRLGEDLDRNGVRLLVARDIGQVRDVLRDEGEDQLLFPSVELAVIQAR
jgi:hypothetical protein